MRQITVDFTSQTYPLFAGYLGEHNATELIAVKPVDMSGAMYSLAFMTNGEVIHSKYFSADEEIKVALWQQLTLDNDLYVQLEAYDDNGDYLGKSTTAKLVLSNSVHGTDMVADADNPDVYSEIAQNSAFRETLEDNVETLDKLTTSALGDLLFDGKPVGDGSGGGGISDELYQEIVANTEARHTHENKDVLDGLSADGESLMFNGKGIGGGAEIDLELLPAQIVASLLSKANVTTVFGTPEEISADDIYTNFFYSMSMDSFLVCVPSESGKLIYMNGDTYEFTEEMNVNKGNLIIFWFNNDMQLSNTAKGGEFIREVLVNGIESVTSES